LLIEGIARLGARTRDIILKHIGATRSTIPGIDLTFNNPPPNYDFGRDVVTFVGDSMGEPVQGSISREALDDHFGTGGLGNEACVERFLEHRSAIEAMARAKYLSWPIEESAAVLIKTGEVAKLRHELSSTGD